MTGSVDNPIVIDSSLDGLLSVESPIGNPVKPSATETNPLVGKNVFNPKTVGVVLHSSSQENRGLIMDTETGLREQNSQITVSSTKEVDKTFNES